MSALNSDSNWFQIPSLPFPIPCQKPCQHSIHILNPTYFHLNTHQLCGFESGMWPLKFLLTPVDWRMASSGWLRPGSWVGLKGSMRYIGHEERGIKKACIFIFKLSMTHNNSILWTREAFCREKKNVLQSEPLFISPSGDSYVSKPSMRWITLLSIRTFPWAK